MYYGKYRRIKNLNKNENKNSDVINKSAVEAGIASPVSPIVQSEVVTESSYKFHLTPWFITGFTDGEGSFILNV